jgi:hypothetical protein
LLLIEVQPHRFRDERLKRIWIGPPRVDLRWNVNDDLEFGIREVDPHAKGVRTHTTLFTPIAQIPIE